MWFGGISIEFWFRIVSTQKKKTQKKTKKKLKKSLTHKKTQKSSAHKKTVWNVVAIFFNH